MSNLITPEARLSYPSLFKPKLPYNAKPGAEPRYEATLVFGPGADLTALKRAALETAKAKWGDDTAKLIKAGKVKLPFLADTEERYEEGSTIVRTWSKEKPGIVDRYAGSDGKPVPITDPAALYPGARVRASVRPFAYDNSGNRGVSFGLINMQKLGDADRFDNRVVVDAADEFEATEKAPADLAGKAGKPAAVEEDELSDLLK